MAPRSRSPRHALSAALLLLVGAAAALAHEEGPQRAAGWGEAHADAGARARMDGKPRPRPAAPIQGLACPTKHAKGPPAKAPKFGGCKSGHDDAPRVATLILGSGDGPPTGFRQALDKAGLLNGLVVVLIDGAAEDGGSTQRGGFRGKPAWQRVLTKSTHHLVFSSGTLGYARALNRLLATAAFSATELVVMPLNTPERVAAASANTIGSWVASARSELSRARMGVAVLAACGSESNAFGTKRRAGAQSQVLAPLPGIPYVVRTEALVAMGGWRAAGCGEDSAGGGCEAASLADLGARLWESGREVVSFAGKAAAADSSSWCDASGTRKPSFESGLTNGTAAACSNAFHAASARTARTRSQKATRSAVLGEFHAGCPSPWDDTGVCSPEPAPAMSLTLQYFRRGSFVTKLGTALRESWQRLGGGTNAEAVVNNDSGDSHMRWSAQLKSMPRAFLVYSNNLHEIRAYNFMSRLSRAEVIAQLQDDDKPHGNWQTSALRLFAARPKLGLLGGYRGRFDGGPNGSLNIKMQAKAHIKYGPSCKNSIATVDPTTKIPFMLIYKVNAAPLVVRRSTFLSLGGFQLGFSCPGASGIGFDFEYSVRNWKAGYEVGLWSANFRKLGGRGGTRASKSTFMKRRRTEMRNNKMLFKLYPNFHHTKGNSLAMSANEALGRRGRNSRTPGTFPSMSSNRQCTDPWHRG